MTASRRRCLTSAFVLSDADSHRGMTDRFSFFSVFAFFSIFSSLEEEYVGLRNAAFERVAVFFRVNSSGYFYSWHENTDTACMDSSVIMPGANKESAR